MHIDHTRGAAAAGRLAEGAALREVVDVGAPDSWIRLDAGVRSDEWCHPTHGLPTWEQADGGRALSAAVRSGEVLTEAQLALAPCHRDGRIREHARRAAFRLVLERGGDVLRRVLVVVRDDPDERLRERAARITALSVGR
ncbi:hypothetical protein [Streptomyces sp. NPDC058335]|uniref:hypothetical protein n=1 Tax=Streptomyces sp. NPDC058335 TaxID=3346451 RepID=UPI00364E8F29